MLQLELFDLGEEHFNVHAGPGSIRFVMTSILSSLPFLLRMQPSNQKPMIPKSIAVPGRFQPEPQA